MLLAWRYRVSIVKVEGAFWQVGPEDELWGKEFMVIFDVK